jgi:hypothetical protein
MGWKKKVRGVYSLLTYDEDKIILEELKDFKKIVLNT